MHVFNKSEIATHENLVSNINVVSQEVLLTPASAENAAIKMSSAQVQFSLNFSSLLAGLVVIALSEVFRQGRQLQEENQLTI